MVGGVGLVLGVVVVVVLGADVVVGVRVGVGVGVGVRVVGAFFGCRISARLPRLGWTQPTGPAENACRTFSVTARTNGPLAGSEQVESSAQIHQIVPVANTPPPLGAL